MENTILGNYYATVALPSKKSLPALMNTNIEEVPLVLRDFKYPISSWPIILSKNEVDELEECCTLIPKLVQKIPSLYFNNDIDKIADFYFNGDKQMAQLAFFSNQNNVETSCRLDLIKSESGFKILEINTGSSIGGMEIQSFKPVIDRMHPELQSTSLHVNARDVQSIYIDFILQKAIALKSKDEDQILIFMAEMISNDGELAAYAEAEKFYNEILNKHTEKYNVQGKVVINNISKAQLQGNNLTYQNERIHVVLIPNFALKDISPDIFRAFMLKTIYFPDHHGTEILRDKRNLAILRTLAEMEKFNEAENKTIKKFIPWSAIIKENTVSYQGETHNLQTLLKEQKDEFVIKIADGLQGDNVYIGKSMSADEWTKTIHTAVTEQKYVVQKFVASKLLKAPNKQNQWTPHTLVWGAFGFGKYYGGTWVRMSAVENNSLVINSSTGAVEAVVYEETISKIKQHPVKEEALPTILGEAHTKLMVADASKKIPALLDATSEKLPNFLRGYKYPVSSWPVVINETQVKTLEQLCVKIPKLLTRIPELYFNNNTKKIADFYFQGDEMITQFAMLCHKKKVEFGCRLDLSLDTEGFKILEANVGSSIGGWQVQSFESMLREMHPNLDENFISKNTQENYIDFLIKNITKHVAYLQKDINVFINLEEEENLLIADIVTFFNELLAKALKDSKYTGNTFAGEYSALELHNNKLLFKGNEIHSVLEIVVNSADIPPSVFRAFIMGLIYFPDNLATRMYGDKRNLGILRELAENKAFSPDENKLIMQSIPWTKEINNTSAIFKGERLPIVDILKKYKDEMVIKIARGFQGKDVFIGKFSSSEEWSKAIEIAIENKNFIAQEFSDSVEVLAPNKNNQWTPHKLIWGAFGFGENYGGVWVRTSEIASDIGVINSATGAIEAIVYEHHEMNEIII